MADQVRVFVSHHHSPDEDAFTAHLVQRLQAAGADVWVDTDRIPSGDFVRKISEGLSGRQWLVLVMTPDALRSPWVQSEVNAAYHQVNSGRMLGIIPVVAAPCDERDIPLLWANLQRYDATHDSHAALAGLLHALGLAIPSSVLPSAPARDSVTSAPRKPERPAGSDAPSGFFFVRLVAMTHPDGSLATRRTEILEWEFALADSPSERHIVRVVYSTGLLRAPLSPLAFTVDGEQSGTFNLNTLWSAPREGKFTAGGLGYTFTWSNDKGGGWRGTLSVSGHTLFTITVPNPNDKSPIRVEPHE